MTGTTYWNLNDAILKAGGLGFNPAGRPFSLPFDENIPAANYSFADEGIGTDFPEFNIRLKDSASTSTEYPDPQKWVKAMSAGSIRVTEGPLPGLELTLIGLALNASDIPWFDRWVEADCIPRCLLMENVDLTGTRAMLEALVPEAGWGIGSDYIFSALPPNVVGKPPQFPDSVQDAVQKADFIEAFMNGEEVLPVESGTYLAPVDVDPTDPSKLLLRLRVSYDDMNMPSPRMMVPRELFYLFFGHDAYYEGPAGAVTALSNEATKAQYIRTLGPASLEAIHHPMLLAMHDAGKAQTKVSRTLTMRLRPPLRTSARVRWEAFEEQDHRKDDWGQSKPGDTVAGHDVVSDEHFVVPEPLNTFRGPAQFAKNFGADKWKCNLFLLEINYRAGFRVPVFFHEDTLLGYAGSMTLTMHADEAAFPPKGLLNAKVALTGTSINGKPNIWGRTTDRWLKRLHALGVGNVLGLFNDSIEAEGRSYIAVGSINRQFEPKEHPSSTKANPIEGIWDPFENFSEYIGHTTQVLKLHSFNYFTRTPRNTAAEGEERLKKLIIDNIAAEGSGVFHHHYEAGISNKTFTMAFNRNYEYMRFNRLHMIEMHPGGDPLTKWGTHDLLVRVKYYERPHRMIDNAVAKPIDLTPDGKPITKPTQKCVDQWWQGYNAVGIAPIEEE